MPSSNNIEFGRSFLSNLAQAAVKDTKKGQTLKQEQAEAAQQNQSNTTKSNNIADTAAPQQVVAAPDEIETSAASSKQAQASTNSPGHAAALQRPQEPSSIQQAMLRAGKAGGQALVGALVEWANGIGCTCDAYAFADHLDVARVEIPLLSATDAAALIHRLKHNKSLALATASPEQRTLVQARWDACTAAYEKRRAQLQEQQRAPVEPSSSARVESRITATQAADVFLVLLKTPYCDAQTRRVIRKPESAKALLTAYKNAGGAHMSAAQASHVRLAMGVVERTKQPFVASVLENEEAKK